MKRKSPYSTGITPNDTHRHDKVARTQQAMKFVSGRIQFGPELDDPDYGAAPETGTPAGCSTPPLEHASTKTVTPAGTSKVVSGQNNDWRQNKHAPKTPTEPTRVAGCASNGDHHEQATPGRSAPRALCKTKLRVAGYNRTEVGVVAPMFIGKSVYRMVERDYRFWFCPNGKCHRGPSGPQCKTQMPPVPTVIPVQIGTGLTQDEVDFLTANGFVLVRRTQAHMSEALPLESEIKVLADAYPEKVQDFPRDHRFKSRGGKNCRQKLTICRNCRTRLERARSSPMKVVFSWTITSGNDYGKLFKIASRPDFSRLYIVQICCFPSCSCKDF
ncbi:hypothetical protein R1sor_021680 [Riccia sorocarpa]|uniref:Uncharacterized protein n=1 Tax=Riccia sorocarpa TaxID=122646 RepID=A0ABD3GNH6_9MARC